MRNHCVHIMRMRQLWGGEAVLGIDGEIPTCVCVHEADQTAQSSVLVGKFVTVLFFTAMMETIW